MLTGGEGNRLDRPSGCARVPPPVGQRVARPVAGRIVADRLAAGDPVQPHAPRSRRGRHGFTAPRAGGVRLAGDDRSRLVARLAGRLARVAGRIELMPAVDAREASVDAPRVLRRPGGPVEMDGVARFSRPDGPPADRRARLAVGARDGVEDGVARGWRLSCPGRPVPVQDEGHQVRADDVAHRRAEGGAEAREAEELGAAGDGRHDLSPPGGPVPRRGGWGRCPRAGLLPPHGRTEVEVGARGRGHLREDGDRVWCGDDGPARGRSGRQRDDHGQTDAGERQRTGEPGRARTPTVRAAGSPPTLRLAETGVSRSQWIPLPGGPDVLRQHSTV